MHVWDNIIYSEQIKKAVQIQNEVKCTKNGKN
jgi:hypothetical protein